MAWNTTLQKMTFALFVFCFILNGIVIRIPILKWSRSLEYLVSIFKKDTILAKYMINNKHRKFIWDLYSDAFETSVVYDYVIFTSFVPSAKRFVVHNNTKRNWPSLGRNVKSVLFTNSPQLEEEFTEAGWDVLPVEYVSQSGTPILKFMYMAVTKRYNASFIGFANSDILFTNELTENLQFLKNNSRFNYTHTMATGRRTDVANVSTEEAGSFKSLIHVSKKRGILFRSDAEDYFFTDPSYPWDVLPDLVIGRVAYDNFLLLHARMLNFSTIDFSKTVRAIHQVVDKGHMEEKWKTTNKEQNYNKILIKSKFRDVNYYAGLTSCLRFETQRKTNETVLHRRQKLHKICSLHTTGILPKRSKG
ncbi:uncharacterized protein LOC127729623 [Mytilus californianus]|uniref:uncharacterized protein LOC127729623 n=1 Tax=Mytilus californianus TaxID=6549 RepID=UPI0022484F7D|nr:uncharacterized protein LOC127729623 [Mytilus californianus]XP_052093434.1 uncharacterized protein LOC127729623 [Mytilus californianus]XP_052093435.1 uncharacterized protein LOC127729623 [Mytilus californianus]